MKKNIKKRYKIKNSIFRILLLFMTLLIGVVLFLGIKHFTSDSYKLKKIGYKKEEVEVIENKLSDRSVNEILENIYLKGIVKIVNDKNFKADNLKKYITVFKKYEYDTNIIQIINDKYYKESLVDRYISYHNKNNTYTARQVVENVNCNLDFEYYKVDNESDLSKKELVIVNKYYKLKNDYVPEDLVKIEKKYGYEKYLQKDAYDAFIKLYKAAEKDGYYMFITSPYRSYKYQSSLYSDYVKNNGKKGADQFSARAGYSEHQTGLAVDLAAKNSMYTKFATTKEYKWMLDNCYKYGFILRYPEGKEKQTGYMFESWHYRYVGLDAAKYIHENNITFDEYYEIFVNKK